MKALVVERSLARFAAARGAASVLGSGRGVNVGPLRLLDKEPPATPGPSWRRVSPRLSGICGSDLSTLDGRSSRYFDPIVSFPFVPGHEVVGDVEGEDGKTIRVVVQPVLGCSARDVRPPCRACSAGDVGRCERVAFGHLEPGLQTGYCAETGGGWSGELVAHQSQLHPVPEEMDDAAAVMVEPAACAIHAALAAEVTEGATVVVLGAGTLGLCAVAALRRLCLPGLLLASAKYPDQRHLASVLGADVVAEPGELPRAVRRTTRSLAVGSQLTGGADVVVDCVGSSASIAQALEVVRPRGQVVMLGMPGAVRVDLAPLWHREVRLAGSYAYGIEHPDRRNGPVPTFQMAFDLVSEASLGRLVSARYPLELYEDAISHAAVAGRRGAVKIVFDLRAAARRSPAKTGPRVQTGRTARRTGRKGK
jgi:threonine dehydrogenase-like Zn-dependent dehydrogenase